MTKKRNAMFKYDIGIPGECKGAFIDNFVNVEKKSIFILFHFTVCSPKLVGLLF